MGRFFSAKQNRQAIDYSVHEAASQSFLMALLSKPLRLLYTLLAHIETCCCVIGRIVLKPFFTLLLRIIELPFRCLRFIITQLKQSQILRHLGRWLYKKRKTPSLFEQFYRTVVSFYVRPILKNVTEFCRFVGRNVFVPIIEMLQQSKNFLFRSIQRELRSFYRLVLVPLAAGVRKVAKALSDGCNVLYNQVLDPLRRTAFHRILKPLAHGVYGKLLTPFTRYVLITSGFWLSSDVLA